MIHIVSYFSTVYLRYRQEKHGLIYTLVNKTEKTSTKPIFTPKQGQCHAFLIRRQSGRNGVLEESTLKSTRAHARLFKFTSGSRLSSSHMVPNDVRAQALCLTRFQLILSKSASRRPAPNQLRKWEKANFTLMITLKWTSNSPREIRIAPQLDGYGRTRHRFRVSSVRESSV